MHILTSYQNIECKHTSWTYCGTNNKIVQLCDVWKLGEPHRCPFLLLVLPVTSTLPKHVLSLAKQQIGFLVFVAFRGVLDQHIRERISSSNLNGIHGLIHNRTQCHTQTLKTRLSVTRRLWVYQRYSGVIDKLDKMFGYLEFLCTVRSSPIGWLGVEGWKVLFIACNGHHYFCFPRIKLQLQIVWHGFFN